MSNKIVSIIIVSGGIREYLKSCLESIKDQGYINIETIVIDNSLNKDFSQEFRECYPDIKWYFSPKNLFYCEAFNRGIEISKGDFILCLNDDVILSRGFIDEALEGFNIDTKIGMVSGKILRPDKKTIDSTGLFLTIWRTVKERGYGCKDSRQFQRSDYIFGVNGAVAFYRRAMLDEIKIDSEYFDSDFRFFYEDLDIAWRAQNFGWRGYYIPRAIAFHIRGGTARQAKGVNKRFARRYLNDELLFDLVKNRYLSIIKNESFFGFLKHLFFILFYDIFAWGYILFFRPQIIKIFFLEKLPLESIFKKRTLLRKLKSAGVENDKC